MHIGEFCLQNFLPRKALQYMFNIVKMMNFNCFFKLYYIDLLPRHKQTMTVNYNG